ncbi:hypothetical protein EI427_07950 [Flammeovirga pectinis]|uniref:Uncharacterized protein n=1 Tax=Flammeovirga pectinis TaxID=2494373 RepID=A0A3S9P1V8_9BACT|nr:hypothetical protein [Flammeovirga pectinis]AZQ62169.1 hypothetical protein EI427_07950 [Flammeovirga pectinis]
MFFFKRWSRKAYSVFNSLSKEIKICMLDIDLHFSAPTLVHEVQSFNSNGNAVDEDDLEEFNLLNEPLEVLIGAKFLDEDVFGVFLAKNHCYNQLLRYYFSKLLSTNLLLHFLCFTSIDNNRSSTSMPYLYYEK